MSLRELDFIGQRPKIVKIAKITKIAHHPATFVSFHCTTNKTKKDRRHQVLLHHYHSHWTMLLSLLSYPSPRSHPHSPSWSSFSSVSLPTRTPKDPTLDDFGGWAFPKNKKTTTHQFSHVGIVFSLSLPLSTLDSLSIPSLSLSSFSLSLGPLHRSVHESKEFARGSIFSLPPSLDS